MKREEYRNGYQPRPESPGSDSDEYTQQVRHQPNVRSNARQARRNTQHPYTSTRYERYEGDPPTLQDREIKDRANLVKFYKDDDRLHRGVTVSINQRQFKSIDSLCEFLNKKIDTKMGVRHIFNLKTKKEVKTVTELERDDVCIVSSFPRYKKDVIMYNMLIEQHSNSPTKSFSNGVRSSRDQGRAAQDRGLQSDSSSRTPNSTAPSKQVTFTIISSTDRYSKEKMILNPNTTQPFEKILEDMGTMVQLKYPPATGIFSARKPYQQIYSFSQLNREVKLSDSFFVCGKEMYPEELRVDDINDDMPSEPEPEPVRKSKRMQQPHPPNKAEPPKRRNQPSNFNQKENETPRQNGRTVKETRKPSKTSKPEEDTRRPQQKGNKTSRFEEESGPKTNRYEDPVEEPRTQVKNARPQEVQQQKRPAKVAPRYEEGDHRKTSKVAPRFEEDNQGKPNGRYEEEEEEEVGVDLRGDVREDEDAEDEDEEDDEEDMASFPQTSRTRKSERLETPEY